MCYDFGYAGLINMFLSDFSDTYVLNMGRLGCLGVTTPLYECSIFNWSHKVTNSKTFVIFFATLCLFVAFRDSWL